MFMLFQDVYCPIRGNTGRLQIVTQPRSLTLNMHVMIKKTMAVHMKQWQLTHRDTVSSEHYHMHRISNHSK